MKLLKPAMKIHGIDCATAQKFLKICVYNAMKPDRKLDRQLNINHDESSLRIFEGGPCASVSLASSSHMMYILLSL